MTPFIFLSDADHPLVQKKASELVGEKRGILEKVESIFSFVRDGVKFGFTPKWDVVKASEVMQYGVGYCNTKATLFVALSRSAGIPARIHFGLIDIRIMNGIFPRFVFPFLPKAGGHSWTEVQIDGEWKSIDSYINDKQFYTKALGRVRDGGKSMGYSVSFIEGRSSCDFNFGEKGFVHMGAVVEDHGTWEDASEYFASPKYTRFSSLQSAFYPALASLANRNVRAIRASSAT